MNTDNYATFARAHSVAKGKHGLEAALDNERLRIDVLAPDCVRIKISRGGVYDENPSFALAIEPPPMTKGFKVSSSAETSTLETEIGRAHV